MGKFSLVMRLASMRIETSENLLYSTQFEVGVAKKSSNGIP